MVQSENFLTSAIRRYRSLRTFCKQNTDGEPHHKVFEETGVNGASIERDTILTHGWSRTLPKTSPGLVCGSWMEKPHP